MDLGSVVVWYMELMFLSWQGLSAVYLACTVCYTQQELI